MPTETNDPADNAVASRRILRLAAGTAAALYLSQAVDWSLSFIAPVLTSVFLALPMSRPKAGFFLVVLLAMTMSVYGSFIFLPILLHQPLAGFVLLALGLFHSFYFTARGGSAVAGTLVTTGITLTVAVGSVSVDALIAVANGVTLSALAGLGVAWLSHAVLPDPAAPPQQAAPPAAAAKVDVVTARSNAFRALAMVLPITVWFLFSPASASNVAVMIKVAAMGQEASTHRVRKTAVSLLVSTIAGGIAAVIGWQVLSIWPSLTMYVLLVAIAGLVFGSRIFAGRGLHEDGETWSYALLTMIVILAPAVLDSQAGSAAGARFYDRLLMFAGATLYAVAAAYIVDAFQAGRSGKRLRTT